MALAIRHAIPAIFEWPEFVNLGGLMSYGTNLADGYHQLGIYAGKVLRGVKPAERPVQQLAKVALGINVKNCEDAGPDLFSLAAWQRRQGDRITAPWSTPLMHLLTTGFGTLLPSAMSALMSVIGG